MPEKTLPREQAEFSAAHCSAVVAGYAAIFTDLEIIMQKIASLRDGLSKTDHEIDDELWLALMKLDRAKDVARQMQHSDRTEVMGLK